MTDARCFAPAAARNRDPILEVLRPLLKAGDQVLEVASGSGEHAVHFATALPEITWQPSDVDASALASIESWRLHSGLANILAPVQLDVLADEWPVGLFDALFCANMIHISPWQVGQALFRHAKTVLRPGGVLFLYGPYFVAGEATAPSNLDFDKQLRERNPEWGIRKLSDVTREGAHHGLTLESRTAMPANNLSLVFRLGL